MDILLGGGILMLPLLICSIGAIAIVLERFWSLRRTQIAPPNLVNELIQAKNRSSLDTGQIKAIGAHSPLGQMIASGLKHVRSGPAFMKVHMEEKGRHLVVGFERYLNMLGTIAAIAPLLGLLGTVVGMIEVFTVLATQASPNTEALAQGISKALLTTAFGLAVAIPSLLFYRYFQRRIDELAFELEKYSLDFLERWQNK